MQAGASTLGAVRGTLSLAIPKPTPQRTPTRSEEEDKKVTLNTTLRWLINQPATRLLLVGRREADQAAKTQAVLAVTKMNRVYCSNGVVLSADAFPFSLSNLALSRL